MPDKRSGKPGISFSLLRKFPVNHPSLLFSVAGGSGQEKWRSFSSR